MSREIKFEYGFESVNGIVKKVYALSEIPNIKQKCDVWNILPIVYVRQFTRLKDINGIDIYDLDIVKLSFKEYYSNECVTVDEESIVIGKITFENGGYFVNEKDSTWFYLNDITEYAEIEVIGNVHTNQELLK